MLENQNQPFFNTIQLSEADWEKENNKALALQQMILEVFEANPKQKISPYQMHEHLENKLGKKVNILSVRRSISNLKHKNMDLLIKLTDMRIGKEGKPEHFFILKSGNEHLAEPEMLMDGDTISDFSKRICGNTT